MKKPERDYPILFEVKYLCCGCTACFAVCPVSAISMQADEEGFLYPVINKKTCIKCYSCLKSCVFK